jgi:Immunity protein 10
MRKFTATAVASTEIPDLDAFVVVLAENMDGSGLRLELQRGLSFDEQDKRLGQDTYCLCTEQGATHYGGVKSWRLKDDELEIDLDDKAAADLGVAGGFVVELKVDKATMARLEEGLNRVLA